MRTEVYEIYDAEIEWEDDKDQLWMLNVIEGSCAVELSTGDESPWGEVVAGSFYADRYFICIVDKYGHEVRHIDEKHPMWTWEESALGRPLELHEILDQHGQSIEDLIYWETL